MSVLLLALFSLLIAYNVTPKSTEASVEQHVKRYSTLYILIVSNTTGAQHGADCPERKEKQPRVIKNHIF